MEKTFVVFEEWSERKSYDLVRGYAATLDEAIELAKGLSMYSKETLYVARTADYEDGNYDTLFAV